MGGPTRSLLLMLPRGLTNVKRDPYCTFVSAARQSSHHSKRLHSPEEDEADVAVSAREGFVAPEEDALAMIMAEAMGERGKAMRERSKEMQRIAAEAVWEGGRSSFKDLAELVHELWKLKGN